MAQNLNPRITQAFTAMKSLGIPAKTVKPVLKRLLKLYDKNWELIEEDNYRTLADAIFEFEEEDKLKDEMKVNIIHDDAGPPLKKPCRGDLEDQVSSTGGNSKSIVDTEESNLRKDSSGLKKVESSHSVSGNLASEPRHVMTDAPSGSKGRDPIQGTRAIYVDNELVQEIEIYERNRYAIVARGKQPIDQSPQFAIPPSAIQAAIPSKGSSTASSGPSVSHSLVAARPQLMDRSNKKGAFHIENDITNGTEKVKISLLDQIGNEDLPQFIYCPENIIYESAYIHVSLARIADDDCCRKCTGDCLSRSIPCACACDTGGEFAYTPDGLLSEKFLQSCISMKLLPDNQHLFYCQDCPLERAKNVDSSGNCKGHLLRKFIKECWRKCGCNMQCGNRVVQRGISRDLQVFLTSDGKGWGLRTLDELPVGAFVCEYVGEILTNIELYERNKKNRGKDKHVYPVLLDADWATEGALKDEEALCLDATYYGNVARFINHRCFDGNLIEIPVQVETPDRHYYHLAFFTKRKVEALEELTWDYGIDFDDESHPIEAFQCSCGSQYCRDRRRKKGKEIVLCLDQ